MPLSKKDSKAATDLIARCEAKRKRAQEAIERLSQIDRGQIAMRDLRKMFETPDGARGLDSVYMDELNHIYQALAMNVKDGVLSRMPSR